MIGIIYKAKNVFTGEVYIGATTEGVEQRKQDHIQKANNNIGSYFQEAIGTYGPEAFIWEQIDTAERNSELAQKEIHYIEAYHSQEAGYNKTKGGEIAKPVYRYNLDGTFDCEFSSLTIAGDSVGVRKQDISRACWNVNHTLEGYFWSYERYDTFPKIQDDRRKAVEQYDLKGNFIAEFDSASEASRQAGISKTCITRCCRGERRNSSGFIWKYN